MPYLHPRLRFLTSIHDVMCYIFHRGQNMNERDKKTFEFDHIILSREKIIS